MPVPYHRSQAVYTTRGTHLTEVDPVPSSSRTTQASSTGLKWIAWTQPQSKQALDSDTKTMAENVKQKLVVNSVEG